jgi:hypothetical protein
MPTQTPPSPSGDSRIDVVIERIQVLQETTKETNEVVKGLDTKLDDFNLTYIGAHQILVSSVEDIRRQVDAHDGELKTLREQLGALADSIKPLLYTNKQIIFLASAITLGVIALIGGMALKLFH